MYPPNVSFNPYLHSSYQRPLSFEPIPTRGHERDVQDRVRALAVQRARRAQYLPEEVYSDEDDEEYIQYGRQGRAYLNAQKRQEMLEVQRRQQQEARERQQEQQRQKALEQRQREEKASQRLLEEQRNQMRLKREDGTHHSVTAEYEGKTRLEQQTQQEAQRHWSPSHGPERQVAHPAGEEDAPVPTRAQQSPSPRSRRASPAPAVPESMSRLATPPSPTPKPTHTIDEQNKAASLIQNRYRVHSSSKALDNIVSQFHSLRKNFAYPLVIEFQKPGSQDGHISVSVCRSPSDFDDDNEEPMDVDGPEGKLAYTSTNYRLLQYSDGLDKFLMKLDGVESWGDKSLRMKRRKFVKDVEKEASKLDRYRKQAWVDYLVKHAMVPQEDTQEEEEEENKAEV